jgi:hypothetical protein
MHRHATCARPRAKQMGRLVERRKEDKGSDKAGEVVVCMCGGGAMVVPIL